MDLLSTSALATGGIAAAAVALWSQLKQALHYLSSFAVVTARIDASFHPAISFYLHTRCKRVPSGLLNYAGFLFTPRRRAHGLIVPFRVAGEKEIYYRGRKVMFVHNLGMTYTVRALRGVVDFDRFVSDAMDAYDAYLEDQLGETRDTSTFSVSHIMGMEKGSNVIHAAGALSTQNIHPRTGNGSDDRPSSSSGTYVCPPDPRYMASFKYSRDDYIESQKQRPFDALYFEPGIMRHVEQARQWFNMQHWYSERSLPWRRGWLLHGPPGTGKSSLARALAQMLGIPLFHFHLRTLSDREFLREWRCLPTPCVVLFEEIDEVWHGREPQTEHKSLSFDTVTNALSGVDSPNGIFLIATTNHLDKVDPTLGTRVSPNSEESTRPGRIDSVIELGLMTRDGRERMAWHILRDWPGLIDDVVAAGEGSSPIQFQERCVQIAFRNLRDGVPPQLVASGRPLAPAP